MFCFPCFSPSSPSTHRCISASEREHILSAIAAGAGSPKVEDAALIGDKGSLSEPLLPVISPRNPSFSSESTSLVGIDMRVMGPRGSCTADDAALGTTASCQDATVGSGAALSKGSINGGTGDAVSGESSVQSRDSDVDKVPLRAIFTSPAVWAVVTAGSANAFSFYLLLACMPTYLVSDLQCEVCRQGGGGGVMYPRLHRVLPVSRTSHVVVVLA